MAIQLSIPVRNRRLDSVEVELGAGAVIKYFTGAKPANCAAANTGTELASMTLPADYMAAASGGTKAKAGTWSGTAIATGDCGHFRIYASDGTTCGLQGTVTEEGAGGDIELAQVTPGLVQDQVFTISTFVLTDGGA
jgi:hypothetical protein